MHISSTMPTAARPRLAFPYDALMTQTDPAFALARAAWLERLADLHLSEGRTGHADRLSQVAHELRCRALGVLA